MGAEPLGLLVSLGLPMWLGLREIRLLVLGIHWAAREHGFPVIGGDTKGTTVLWLVGTGLGWVPSGTACAGARQDPGQVVCVTGTPGRFGTALAYFLGGRKTHGLLSGRQERGLAQAFRQPTPHLRPEAFSDPLHTAEHAWTSLTA